MTLLRNLMMAALVLLGTLALTATAAPPAKAKAKAKTPTPAKHHARKKASGKLLNEVRRLEHDLAKLKSSKKAAKKGTAAKKKTAAHHHHRHHHRHHHHKHKKAGSQGGLKSDLAALKRDLDKVESDLTRKR